MDSNNSALGCREILLEDFGAQLTEAACPVMLRHGAVDHWLELELWRVLRATVKKWDQEWPSAGVVLVRFYDPQDGSALGQY